VKRRKNEYAVNRLTFVAHCDLSCGIHDVDAALVRVGAAVVDVALARVNAQLLHLLLRENIRARLLCLQLRSCRCVQPTSQESHHEARVSHVVHDKGVEKVDVGRPLLAVVVAEQHQLALDELRFPVGTLLEYRQAVG